MYVCYFIKCKLSLVSIIIYCFKKAIIKIYPPPEKYSLKIKQKTIHIYNMRHHWPSQLYIYSCY